MVSHSIIWSTTPVSKSMLTRMGSAKPATGRPGNDRAHAATIGCELPHLLQVVLDPASSPGAAASSEEGAVAAREKLTHATG